MKWLYYRFIYRHLMRLAHRFNWHHTRTIYPEGDTLLVCDWCGLRYLKQKRNWTPPLPPDVLVSAQSGKLDITNGPTRPARAIRRPHRERP